MWEKKKTLVANGIGSSAEVFRVEGEDGDVWVEKIYFTEYILHNRTSAEDEVKLLEVASSSGHDNILKFRNVSQSHK